MNSFNPGSKPSICYNQNPLKNVIYYYFILHNQFKSTLRGNYTLQKNISTHVGKILNYQRLKPEKSKLSFISPMLNIQSGESLISFWDDVPSVIQCSYRFVSEIVGGQA